MIAEVVASTLLKIGLTLVFVGYSNKYILKWWSSSALIIGFIFIVSSIFIPFFHSQNKRDQELIDLILKSKKSILDESEERRLIELSISILQRRR